MVSGHDVRAIPRFELEHWMHRHEGRGLLELSGSTGPIWTIAELLEMGDADPGPLLATPLTYSAFDGSRDLRGAVADYVGVSADDVMITTGASEALAILFASRGGAGGNVVVPSPGYPSFSALPRVFGMEARGYELDAQDGFRMQPARLLEHVDGDTRAVVVNSPHNPTGACIRRDDLIEIGAELAARDVTLIVDRVFHAAGHPVEPWAVDDVPDAVIVGDMSKALSLAGLRIGWIADRNPRRREPYIDLRGYFTLSSPPFEERLATIALRNHRAILERARQVMDTNLDALEVVIDRHHTIDWVRPMAGPIAFPWLTGTDDARPFCERAAAAGLLLVPGDCLGYPRHVRVGYGASDTATFARAMELLEGLLRS